MLDIQPKLLSLHKLFQNRLFRIPQYQRAYSWESKHRKDMFSDISALKEEPDRHHFMATIVGLKKGAKVIVTDNFDSIDVVDGQQRLTTLVILLKAIEKALSRKKEDATHAKLQLELNELLVKSDDLSLVLLQTNHDSSLLFIDYLRTGETKPRSIAKTIADRAIIDAISDCEKFVEQFDDIVGLISILKNRLYFIFHEITDEATVYKVFEVLNSRGLSVPWIDRLKSILMGVVFEHASGNRDEIIDELHQIWGDVYRTIGMRQGLNNETLKFAATLKNPTNLSRVLSEERAVELFKKIAARDPQEAVNVSRWILKVAAAVDQFMVTERRSKAVTRISHARLLAVAIVLEFNERAEEILVLWERISFRIFGLCDRDARTKVGVYVRLSWDCLNKKLSPKETIERLESIPEGDEELTIEWAVEHLRETNCYHHWEEELRYLLYRYEEYLAKAAGNSLAEDQWSRIWEASTSNTIEHILPQSSDDEFDDDYSSVHWLGNLMLLPPGMNSSLGDKKPIEKTDDYRSTGLQVANEVAGSIEKSEGWNEADIQNREGKIIDWLREEWS